MGLKVASNYSTLIRTYLSIPNKKPRRNRSCGGAGTEKRPKSFLLAFNHQIIAQFSSRPLHAARWHVHSHCAILFAVPISEVQWRRAWQKSTPHTHCRRMQSQRTPHLISASWHGLEGCWFAEQPTETKRSSECRKAAFDCSVITGLHG